MNSQVASSIDRKQTGQASKRIGLAGTCWQLLPLREMHLQSSLALAIAVAVNCSGATRAQDAQEPASPPVVQTARLPDDGQPPAPEIIDASPAPADVSPLTSKKVDVQTIRQSETNDVATFDVSDVNSDVADVSKSDVADVAKAEVLPNESIDATLENAARQDNSQVRELSVEPELETKPVLPLDRPSWVGTTSDLTTSVHRLYVGSFPMNTEAEAESDEAIDEPMQAALLRYLDETLLPGEDAGRLRISSEYIRKNLLDKSTSYMANLGTTTGAYQKWIVLEITREQRNYLVDLLREQHQRDRMGALGGSLLALMGVTALFNYGFNRRRRRYAADAQPTLLAMLPVGMLENLGAGHSPVHYATAQPLPVGNAVPKRRRSILGKLFFFTLAIVAVGFMMAFSAVKVRTARQEYSSEANVRMMESSLRDEIRTQIRENLRETVQDTGDPFELKIRIGE